MTEQVYSSPPTFECSEETLGGVLEDFAGVVMNKQAEPDEKEEAEEVSR